MAEHIDVSAPDGVADAYLARPGGEPRPGVLFLMDAFGLRPAIEDMVDRIAAEGYAVLAPNLLHRSGRSPIVAKSDLTDPSAREGLFDRLRPMMAELTPERVAADGAAYLDRLAADAAPGPVAITGYCLGVRVGWRIAAAHPERVAALAGFHGGGLVTDAPDSPHLAAGRIRAELYFGFADQDRSMPAEQIATFERALDAAGARYRSEVYEGAQHGYTMADTAAYDEAASERQHRELTALLQRTFA
jgi:carboxymethylenebutenolidase